jgi:hypothetical protein
VVIGQYVAVTAYYETGTLGGLPRLLLWHAPSGYTATKKSLEKIVLERVERPLVIHVPALTLQLGLGLDANHGRAGFFSDPGKCLAHLAKDLDTLPVLGKAWPVNG